MGMRHCMSSCRHHQSFDLVITDQTMPHMPGEVLVRALRRIRPDIPVILCTGYSSNIDAKKAKVQGIEAFLMKLSPSTPSPLLFSVSWHGARHPPPKAQRQRLDSTRRFTPDKSPPDGAVPSLYSLSLSHSVRRADAAGGAGSCSAALIQRVATDRAPHGSPLPLPAWPRHR